MAKAFSAPSNLDHVVASSHLRFRSIPNKNPMNEDPALFQAGESEVDVRGWVDETARTKQDSWIAKFSDHSYLYFEVQKV